MTQREIYDIARRQSSIDLSCAPEDFLSHENRIVISRESEDARRYLKLPFFCQLVSYGSNVVASVSEDFAKEARRYVETYPVEHLFETPNMHVLSDMLRPHGHDICFMAEYFLPDLAHLKPLSCPYETRLLTPEAFAPLYTPEWSNALCKDRAHLDCIAIGAYDGDRLIGLAGASADCDTMWQIGIDVLPEYRRRGIASALTANLAMEILKKDIVPFYCAAWCNIRSVRNAIKSGFRPAWAELTAKPVDMIKDMNRRD